MRLDEFLDMCDQKTPIVIHNIYGIGGAELLTDEGWAVSDAKDNLFSDWYSVAGIELRDGKLWVDVKENPWAFESYWDNPDNDEYEVEIAFKVDVVEPSIKAAKHTALERVMMGDADGIITSVKRNGEEVF